MAKKAYVGINDTARAIKSIYVGIGGVSRRVKKAYVGVNGVAQQFYAYYTPVTYIESTGTQYIDTGFKHNQNTRFVADMEFSDLKNYTYPFGSFGGASGTRKLFVLEITNKSPQTLGTYYKTKIDFLISASGRHTIDLNKNVHTIDNTTNTYTKSNFQSEYNDIIFGTTNYDGNVSQKATTMKLYSFKIYDNDTLVRDYIPVLDYKGVPCLYDKVGDQFYYNQGTGTFNYG